ncbi:unnamed protein product, partial [marine sediment metagenome]
MEAKTTQLSLGNRLDWFWFLLPALILVVVFFFIPVIIVFIISLT